MLCRQADLPVFVLITPAHVQDRQVGWLLVVLAVLVFAFRVLAVYADAAYFDKRFVAWVHDFSALIQQSITNCAELVNAS